MAGIDGNVKLFTEQPLIWVPSCTVMSQIMKGSVCAYCAKIFGPLGKTLRVNCRRCRYGLRRIFADVEWCSKACAKKDEGHSADNDFLTCEKADSAWRRFIGLGALT
jgi:DNA-directed RNA polymerase subunit RPC12/RpoP